MNEIFFAQAFDKSPVGMAFLKEDGTILSANPSLVATLGKDLWLIVGSRIEHHMRVEEAPAWLRHFTAFRDGSASGPSFESRFQPTDGRDSWWSIQLADIAMDWGGERCFYAVIQDISVQKHGEQKLRESRQMAESANRAKSQFLANMSHEIRTPLFTITGMTELLRLSELGRDQDHHASQIASAAQHLLDLVNDILDFSKIEAGQMSLESIPFDLDDVLSRSLEVVTLAAYRKGLELVLDLDPTVPRTWLGDPGRLRQILVNLLSNAVKFTGQGRVVLTVTHQEQDPSGRELLNVRVADTGIGISETSRSALFQVFSQADSSTTRQFGGTGLGLAISQKLVKMLGGEIGFTSQPGKGTEFSFTVSLQRNQDPELASARPGQGRSLLLIDDDAGVRDVVGGLLRQSGFAVRTASNRSEALESLQLQIPAAVLVDQELGNLDGWQLAWELKQFVERDVPFVLMSVLRKTFEPSPRYPSHVFQGFIDKPVNPRRLVDFLVRGLAGDWPDPDHYTASGALLPRPATHRLVVKRARMLVAEDHEVNRQLFHLLLRTLGHEVLLVENGKQALDQVLDFAPQLVFMDLQMPEMNGYESALGMRRKGVTVPIIAVTASAVKGELERCLTAGMNGILTKPFTLEALEGAIRSFAPHLVVPEGPPSGADFSFDDALAVFLGNRELLISLLGRFLPRTRDTLDQLALARAAGDWGKVTSLAHAIKGSAYNLTAKTLGDAAHRMEQAAREQRSADCSALEPELVSAFETFASLVEPLL